MTDEPAFDIDVDGYTVGRHRTSGDAIAPPQVGVAVRKVGAGSLQESWERPVVQTSRMLEEANTLKAGDSDSMNSRSASQ